MSCSSRKGVGIILEQDDLTTFQSGFLMILPKNNKGHDVLSYEPIKAIRNKCNFESQRRCFRHCLTKIQQQQQNTIQSNSNIQPVTLISFLEEEVISSEAYDDSNTFIDIMKSFPTIQIEFVHIFLEPVGLGWYSYQENATRMLRQLFIMPNQEQMEFHTLPSYNPYHKRQVSIQEYGENIALVFGFDMSHFPERLGGGWTMQKFLAYQQIDACYFK
jgi:hypothetical protein